jgi:DNA-directed RNA polymerase subunit RPC12/RpoP
MAKFKHHSHFPKERDPQLYLLPFVCFACRKSFRKPRTVEPRRCPQCAGPVTMLGRKFCPPKAAQIEQWKKVQYLAEHGFLFHSLWVPIEPGVKLLVKYPKTLAEAKRFVVQYQALVVPGSPRSDEDA